MDPAGQVTEHPWITSGTLQRVLENAQELDIFSVNKCKDVQELNLVMGDLTWSRLQ